MRMGTAVEYARGRIEDHLLRSAELRRMLDTGQVDLGRLAALERTLSFG